MFLSPSPHLLILLLLSLVLHIRESNDIACFCTAVINSWRARQNHSICHDNSNTSSNVSFLRIRCCRPRPTLARRPRTETGMGRLCRSSQKAGMEKRACARPHVIVSRNTLKICRRPQKKVFLLTRAIEFDCDLFDVTKRFVVCRMLVRHESFAFLRATWYSDIDPPPLTAHNIPIPSFIALPYASCLLVLRISSHFIEGFFRAMFFRPLYPSSQQIVKGNTLHQLLNSVPFESAHCGVRLFFLAFPR